VLLVCAAGAGSALLRTSIAAAIMGLALFGWTQLPIDSALLSGAGGILVGGIVYGGAALVLRVEELQGVMRWLVRRRS
jgi:hypothetical protein